MVWNSSTRRQITATSDVSVDDAIARALSISREGYKEPDWFDVLAARGFISNGRVTHYQVTLDLGYETRNPTHDGICSNEFYFQRACGGAQHCDAPHTIETRI